MRALAITLAVLLAIVGIALWSKGCSAPDRTQIFRAIESGDVQKVKNMLAAKPQLLEEQAPPWGNTPLMEALKHCSVPIVQTVLDRGADVNEANDVGLTPLMIAARYGCEPAMPLLVKRGALVNARDPSGVTLLHLACGHPASVSTLLRLGADARARAVDGVLPIHFAALAQEPASLKLLLQAGDTVNARDDRDRTVLMHVVMPAVWRATAKECVTLLLQQGADPTLRDRFGYTVLHHLAAFPRRYLEQEVKEAQIDFRQQEQWRMEVARMLLRAGADPKQKDVEGKTAADLARAGGSMDLARLLQQGHEE